MKFRTVYTSSLNDKAYSFFGSPSGTETEILTILNDGSMGIGTSTPDTNAKLTVKGKVHSREVKVSVNAGADFVFNKDYRLAPLEELAAYISENKHLPEIPSAKEMEEKGIEVGEMNIKLLQKIEELTLHLIRQNNRLEAQSIKLAEKDNQITALTARMEKFEKK
jgi:hypothetical protein